MAFLGRENIVHRDLCADNIMVGENYHVKVGGFSLARVMESDVFYASKGKWECDVGKVYIIDRLVK